jgi:hypothetical protein
LCKIFKERNLFMSSDINSANFPGVGTQTFAARTSNNIIDVHNLHKSTETIGNALGEDGRTAAIAGGIIGAIAFAPIPPPGAWSLIGAPLGAAIGIAICGAVSAAGKDSPAKESLNQNRRV